MQTITVEILPILYETAKKDYDDIISEEQDKSYNPDKNTLEDYNYCKDLYNFLAPLHEKESIKINTLEEYFNFLDTISDFNLEYQIYNGGRIIYIRC